MGRQRLGLDESLLVRELRTENGDLHVLGTDAMLLELYKQCISDALASGEEGNQGGKGRLTWHSM